MIKTVTIYLSLFAILYFAGSFIAWNLNPVEWLWIGRFFFVLIYVALVIAIDIKNTK